MIDVVRRSWAIAGVVLATPACTSILGDFVLGGPDASVSAGDGGTAPSSDARADVPTTIGPALRDASEDARDGGNGGDGGDASACEAGMTACASGCVDLDDASANCGTCGLDCHGASCTAGTCGAYTIAQQPTTGAVAKLATDGTRVVWADTGKVAIEQIAATGGTAIALAPASSTQGAVGSELALAGSTVAFSYLGTTAPSVGLAAVDVADSGVSVLAGAVAVAGISLNAQATHVFFQNVTGTQGELDDCPISGLETDAGACAAVAGGGRFLQQTAADGTYMVFDQTGADEPSQEGLYLDTISTRDTTIFATDTAHSLAVDGTWAYWTVQNDGGLTYAVRRTLESAPGTVVQTLAVTADSSAFAVDGFDVYYWTGSAIAAAPASGGAAAALAPASAFVQIAVGGGLLVWTDGATISGLVLPAH